MKKKKNTKDITYQGKFQYLELKFTIEINPNSQSIKIQSKVDQQVDFNWLKVDWDVVEIPNLTWTNSWTLSYTFNYVVFFSFSFLDEINYVVFILTFFLTYFIELSMWWESFLIIYVIISYVSISSHNFVIIWFQIYAF